MEIINRGSEWNKWDLHIHTPHTKKEDNYVTSNDSRDVWDKYITELENSDIKVFGITDYFSLDNYYYLKNQQDNNGRLQGKILLPNVELRIFPVAKHGNAINIHVIFDPKMDRKDIEREFFSNLKMNSTSGNEYRCIKEDLIAYGKELKRENYQDDDTPIREAISKFCVNYEEIFKIISKPIFKNRSLIAVSNTSKDGVSGLQTTGGNLDQIRTNIYQKTDIIFSHNPRDVDYFLGKGVDSPQKIIEMYGRLKPCISGSDAHSFEQIGKYTDNRYTWIKAELSFAGLKQIIYEPEARVKMQESLPEEKMPTNVIDYIVLHSDKNDFTEGKKIYLNPNLNTIIGGKSSGKSLLLHSIAKAIQEEEVHKKHEKLKLTEYNEIKDFDVFWKDGVEGKNRQITYIPQSYINLLVERDRDGNMNELILNILKQNENFNKFYNEKIEKIRILNESISKGLSFMESKRNEFKTYLQEYKNIGKEDDIEKEVSFLDQKIKNLMDTSVLSREEKDKLEECNENIKNKLEEVNQLNQVIELIGKLKETSTTYLGDIKLKDTPNDKENIIDVLNRILNYYDNVPTELKAIINKFTSELKLLNSKFRNELDELHYDLKLNNLNKNISEIREKISPLLAKLKNQKEIIPLQEKRKAKINDLQKSQSFNKKIGAIYREYEKQQDDIYTYLIQRNSAYDDIRNFVNEKFINIGDEIRIKMSTLFRKTDSTYFSLVNKNKEALKSSFFYKIYPNEDEFFNYGKLPSLFKNAKRVINGSLEFKNKHINTINLNKEATFENTLRSLTEDKIFFDFDIKYKDDSLSRMSPGKKGTLLLILLLSLSNSESPIIIDQPEDNLDNRTIYGELCSMIRKSKIKRQIIMATHNANLVVGTDSENIMVANQSGAEVNSSTPKFDYINGPIENSLEDDTNENELLRVGIREHVCDILEGGKDAFEKREQKYGFE